MNNRFTHYMVVYTLTVMMILLRPYFAYQIASHGDFARDTERVARILQRLVKKKESHIDDNEEAMELTRSGDVEFVLPLLFVLILRRRLSWLLALLAGNALNWNRNTVFQVSPTNNYFQLISRLQI